MTHDVFVSYSSGDKLTADALVATLERAGIRCWVAPRDVMPGDKWADAIVRAIDGGRLMVLVFTSDANASQHIIREVELAAQHRLPVIPLRVEDVKPCPTLDYYIAGTHWLDAIDPPLEAHLERLTKVIGRLLEAPQAGMATQADRGTKPKGRVPTSPPFGPTAAVSAATGVLSPPVSRIPPAAPEILGRVEPEVEGVPDMPGRVEPEVERVPDMPGRVEPKVEEVPEMPGRVEPKVEVVPEMPGRVEPKVEVVPEMPGRVEPKVEVVPTTRGRRRPILIGGAVGAFLVLGVGLAILLSDAGGEDERAAVRPPSPSAPALAPPVEATLAAPGPSAGETGASGETGGEEPKVRPPLNLHTGLVGAYEVRLLWERAPHGARVDHFIVFRNDDRLESVEDRLYADRAVSPSSTYTYRVVAVGVDGSRASSKELSVTTSPPPTTSPPSTPASGPQPSPPSGCSTNDWLAGEC